MPKYVCIKSKTESVPEGTVIIATPCGAGRILVIQDRDLTVSEYDDMPYFQRGQELPLTGSLWQWELVPRVAIIGPTLRVGSHLKI